MKRRTTTILAAVLAVAAVSTAVLSSLPANAETAAFRVASSWSTGYQAEITVGNPSSSAISTWKVELTLPAGTSVTQAWSSTLTSSGNTYTFTPAAWNGTIAANASTNFGFIVTGTGQPTACLVNGQTCTGTTVPTSSPTTSPSASPSTSTSPPPVNGTPVGINGQLKVCGTKLCNQYGKPIQLRGMSTHGIQWFPGCYTDAGLDALATDWNSDLFRVSMYVQEQGYETDPAGFTTRVNNLVDKAEQRGMYALIDFHILTPGDPMYNLDRAKTFFAQVSARNAAKKNVIYEIANEPNGVSWATIKNYAEQVIPVIRANDPDAVVVVGTRGWSSLGVSEGGSSSEIVANPVNASNVMYTFHFYAASHKDNYRAEVERAAASLPLFVTEFGTVTYTGDGAVDTASSNTWLDLLDRLQISYANWTFSDAGEGSAALKAGTCAGGSFAGTGVLTESGLLMRSRIRTADNFPTS
ncbi:endoglucanase [Actinoplanes lobatus]|uniref:Endoglucanase n=1 Tax=Actinoplanes lobatus TaxID=113568 RepID=A0A7W7MLA4_9ACTN|nr:cellulase family glycosylhydrolase [Actinoplanes lobatus]MBB4754564.1 endoglucanase [Actinoplanes lobatus]GGN66296.1 endoglucanase [Actinoplanes lobatus]GIE45901.1 endoglucanase [Actinoplanes lobatus]